MYKTLLSEINNICGTTWLYEATYTKIIIIIINHYTEYKTIIFPLILYNFSFLIFSVLLTKKKSKEIYILIYLFLKRNNHDSPTGQRPKLKSNNRAP